MSIMEGLPTIIIYLWLAGLVWMVGVVTFTIIRRRKKGQPLTRPEFDDALFLEKWRSGRSDRNVLARLGGASNCLWVAVTREGLRIAPHFPFNLMPTNLLGLEHNIPATAIQWVAPNEGLLGRMVRIRITNEKGADETLEIQLKHHDKFMEAIAAIKAPAR